MVVAIFSPRTKILLSLAIVVASAGLAASSSGQPVAQQLPQHPDRGAVRGIIENRGQIDSAALYYTCESGLTVYFTATTVVLDLHRPASVQHAGNTPARYSADGLLGLDDTLPGLDDTGAYSRRGCAVWVRFTEANPTPAIEVRGEQTTKFHYFLGDDPAAWRSQVPAWSEIVYHDLWPGIDLRFQVYGDRLRYQVDLAPGADPAQVRFGYEGAEQVIRRDTEVRLIETPVRTLTEERPAADLTTGAVVWSQPAGGPPRDGEDLNNPSVLLWSTFLGADESDKGVGITLDPNGYPVITGRTRSILFPTTPGSYDTFHAGINDVFVAKLDPTGATLLWSTFLGGPFDDAGLTITLDAVGNPVVAGIAGTPGFPTTPGAYDETSNGLRDAFVAKLDATGSNLLWSTYLGGSVDDAINRVLIDPAGCPVVAGITSSPEFPSTPGAFDIMHNGDFDAFVGKLAADGSDLIACTFLGGGGIDLGKDLALDPDGRAFVSGETSSPTFPTTPGAYATVHAGGADVFVAKLDMEAATLIWSTLLGGDDDDVGGPIVFDAAGDLVMAGSTESTDFPVTPGVLDSSFNGVRDCFVAKLHGDGDELLWSTFLGGGDRDKGQALTIDPVGNTVVTGYSRSADFPTTQGAFDRSHNGSSDVFIAKIGGEGTDLIASTLLGGEGLDDTYSTVLDAAGNLLLIGMAASADFPTTPGAYDETYDGLSDVYVVKLDLSLMGPVAVGGASPDALLWSSYPNPFNPATTIVFSLPAQSEVSLAIHDVSGRRVRTLLGGSLDAGRHTVRWNGRDDAGRTAAAGVYLVRLTTADRVQVQKIALIK